MDEMKTPAQVEIFNHTSDVMKTAREAHNSIKDIVNTLVGHEDIPECTATNIMKITTVHTMLTSINNNLNEILYAVRRL